MADPRKSVLLRIPADLWESLNRWARDDLRSLNAQIEWALRESLRRHRGERLSAPGDEALVRRSPGIGPGPRASNAPQADGEPDAEAPRPAPGDGGLPDAETGGSTGNHGASA